MKRKHREINGSYVIAIPKQVCDLYGFKQNDKLNILPIGNGELRLTTSYKLYLVPDGI